MPTVPAANRQVMLNNPRLGSDAIINGSSIRCIFDNEYTDVLDVTGTTPAATCDVDDLAAITPAVARGTTITISGTDYTIQNMKPDGTGFTVLILSD